MQFLQRLSLSHRLALLIASAVLGVAAITVIMLVDERHKIMDERRLAVRHTVELAHGMVSHHHDEATRGRYGMEEAQSRAKAALAALRYGEGDYFWINDMHPRMVMHPIKPALDGKDLSTNEDPQGKRLFVAFVDVVKADGAGFVDYLWPKPGSDEPVQKVSYVQGFEPWGWVIGSGVYVDSVDAVVWGSARRTGLQALVLMAAMLLVGLAVRRSLLSQIGGEPVEASALVQRLATGDLTTEIAIAPGDRGSMLAAIRSMRDGLTGLVQRVHDGSQALATASAEIAQGNLDLSQRTERQAAALQQTAASMAELGAAVQHTEASARRANALAQQASGVAVQGGEVVSKVVDTMQGIHTSSRRIADIIGVVDGIAFQTNILALNAAVEAARAGEQGRGFAVVASEVRTLAGRSAVASREIKGLIDESVRQVAAGSTLVEQARTTMTEVVDAIQRATEEMDGISRASHQQSQGVAQVGAAVTQMDEVTQQNAALVEQSAAAAENLNVQAQRLVQAVSAFRLAPDGHDAVGRTLPAVAPRAAESAEA